MSSASFELEKKSPGKIKDVRGEKEREKDSKRTVELAFGA